MSIIKKVEDAVKWAWEALSTMAQTHKTNAQRKEMLKTLLQKSTSKQYKEQTGQKYNWPSDATLIDRPTIKWNQLYKQNKDKYKKLS